MEQYKIKLKIALTGQLIYGSIKTSLNQVFIYFPCLPFFANRQWQSFLLQIKQLFNLQIHWGGLVVQLVFFIFAWHFNGFDCHYQVSLRFLFFGMMTSSSWKLYLVLSSFTMTLSAPSWITLPAFAFQSPFLQCGAGRSARYCPGPTTLSTQSRWQQRRLTTCAGHFTNSCDY